MRSHHQRSLTSYDNKGYSSITNIANGVSNGATEKSQNGVIQNKKIANGGSFIGKILVCFRVD